MICQKICQIFDKQINSSKRFIKKIVRKKQKETKQQHLLTKEPTFVNKRTRIAKQQHETRFLEAPLVRHEAGYGRRA